jgi:hypothetical protein
MINCYFILFFYMWTRFYHTIVKCQKVFRFMYSWWNINEMKCQYKKEGVNIKKTDFAVFLWKNQKKKMSDCVWIESSIRTKIERYAARKSKMEKVQPRTRERVWQPECPKCHEDKIALCWSHDQKTRRPTTKISIQSQTHWKEKSRKTETAIAWP